MKNQLFIFIFFWLFSLNLLSAHNGSINGQITEVSSGVELAGAVVVLEPGNLTATSNTLGFFSFTNLQAGKYTLTVRYIGFELQKVENVQVHDSETTTLRIELTAASIDLRTVEIKNTSIAKPFEAISALDIHTRPVNTAQDVLRMVPGLFIAQHAGGGKAEQIFLRGFDCDHGTDVAISVDGIPVNMPSHAHGQGYADTHFIIPELIENVEFKKGPYYADAGDFNTAGLVRYRTKDALDKSFVKVEAGEFNTARAVGAFDLLGQQHPDRRNQHAYIAAETFYTDGYFKNSQVFHRLNLIGKYTSSIAEDQRITFTASAFQSSWNASGQIPERALQRGLITRFGSIDSSEGGLTSRYNLNFEHLKTLKNNGMFKNRLYYSDYSFELYSDFTFFLNDPVHGDEIRQKEHRKVFGYNGTYEQEGHLAGRRLRSEIGIFFRNDNIDNSELSRVYQRRFTTAPLSLGDINETNTGAFVSETWEFAPGFHLNAALREDVFQFAYNNKLDSLYRTQKVTRALLSPKLNLYYDLNSSLRLYINSGYGFHSNDARVVIPQNGVQVLPKAVGTDVGAIFKPIPSLYINVAGWFLDLQQEFVYSGDEAIVEPGGKTRRYGMDFSARLQVAKHFFADADFTWAHGRSLDAPEGSNYIALAPKFTGTGGISYDQGKGPFGSLRFRYLSARPANEDNSLTAEGYFLLDAVAGWKIKNVEISFSAQNLGNVAWKEAQFATESRLKDEPAPVTEIHFTPGTPFVLKGGITVRF
jgi:outer membrane receptor protein involved in Fe transport